MTEHEATQLVAMLAAAHPRVTISPETVAVYYAGLADLRFDRGRDACVSLIQTSRWFPTVAEIRDEAALLAEQTAARERATRPRLAEAAPYPPEKQLEVNREGIARIKQLLARIGRTIDTPKETT